MPEYQWTLANTVSVKEDDMCLTESHTPGRLSMVAVHIGGLRGLPVKKQGGTAMVLHARWITVLLVGLLHACAFGELTTSFTYPSLLTPTDVADAVVLTGSSDDSFGGTLLGYGDGRFAEKGPIFGGSLESNSPSEPVAAWGDGGPSGASLILLGLGTLGALGVGRSARLGQSGPIAEWWHGGGPTQIAHAVAIDPDFQLAASSSYCCLDGGPGGCRPCQSVILREASHPRGTPQHDPRLRFPRGPPITTCFVD
ncbi:MAG: hypothetical protein JXQ75_01205 [Phycisphaerae bacterium]|nr:hypothetical protein [Phycisphaerae bacterium]